jgi:hypothetical protein
MCYFQGITFMGVVAGMETLLDGSDAVIVTALLDSGELDETEPAQHRVDDDDDVFHEFEPAVESVPSLSLR